jgi:hypothetical protein
MFYELRNEDGLGMIVLYQVRQQYLIAYVLNSLLGWQRKLLYTDLVEIRRTIINRILEGAKLIMMCRQV